MAYFNSGSDRVQQYEFKEVLALLDAPSPWREYIRPNLATVRSKMSSDTFQVVSSAKFDEVMTGLGGTNSGAIGVTDKQTGRITMKEWGPNSERTYLLAALHECVHLVSHPAEQGKPHSTAWMHLGSGLLEGMVECVTEDILAAQRLALPSADSGMLGYQDGKSAIAREFLTNASVPFYGRVLFNGNGEQLRAVMDFIYSPVGWKRIKDMITVGWIRDARNQMVRLRAQEEDKRNQAIKATQQQMRAQQQQQLAKTLFDVILHLP